MFELRSDEKKFPIIVDSYEKAVLYQQLVLALYDREIFVTSDGAEYEFDINVYNKLLLETEVPNVDVIILGLDLANLQQKEDFSAMLNPIIEANEKLVSQYKEGNDKALNALLGKFLKENRGYDPKEVKEELIKLLS